MLRLIDKVNREDIWKEAAKEAGIAAADIPQVHPWGEEFFDGVKFDPEDPLLERVWRLRNLSLGWIIMLNVRIFWFSKQRSQKSLKGIKLMFLAEQFLITQ